MPFTFSHPAIVLPLTYFPKKWFSLTGLIIGSLTPDFEYFIRMKISSIYSHTLSGILWFDFPLAFILCFIFHQIIRNTFIQNLPAFLQARFLIFTSFDWKNHVKNNWLVVSISIIIGIFSHLFWDSFTHEDGYFVTHLSVLKSSIILFEKPVFVFKTLQHSSTFIGAIIIIFSIFNVPKTTIETYKIDVKYWLTIMLFSIIILAIRFIFEPYFLQIGNIIVSSISAFMISMVISSFLSKKSSYSF